MTKIKPDSLTIHKVRLTRRHVKIHYTNNSADVELTENEVPLPSFKAAIDALAPLVIQICHLPDAYGDNMRVSGLTLTLKGLVTIQAQKSFDDASGPLNLATPLRFLELPAEEGTYSPPLTVEQVGLIDAVTEEAKRYVLGERAQGTLPLVEDEDDDEKETGGDEEVLEFSTKPTDPDPSALAAVPAKKKGKPPKGEMTTMRAPKSTPVVKQSNEN